MRGQFLACSEFIRSSLQEKVKLKSKPTLTVRQLQVSAMPFTSVVVEKKKGKRKREKTRNAFANKFLQPVVTF